jgi:hypothetical protein
MTHQDKTDARGATLRAYTFIGGGRPERIYRYLLF